LQDRRRPVGRTGLGPRDARLEEGDDLVASRIGDRAAGVDDQVAAAGRTAGDRVGRRLDRVERRVAGAQDERLGAGAGEVVDEARAAPEAVGPIGIGQVGLAVRVGIGHEAVVAGAALQVVDARVTAGLLGRGQGGQVGEVVPLGASTPLEGDARDRCRREVHGAALLAGGQDLDVGPLILDGEVIALVVGHDGQHAVGQEGHRGGRGQTRLQLAHREVGCSLQHASRSTRMHKDSDGTT
jgi:hypothetical protein